MENTTSNFSYNYNKNYYFNTENIPNSTLVFETFEFLEAIHYDSLLFVNIMYKQYLEAMTFLDKPFDYITQINAIPIEDQQKFHLKAMILKWYGGMPPQNMNKQLNTILKLLFKEIESIITSDNETSKMLFHFYSNATKNEKYAIASFKLSQAMNGTNFESRHFTPPISEPQTKQPTPPLKTIEPINFTGSTKRDLPYIFWQLEKLGLIENKNLGLTLSKVFTYLSEPIDNTYFNAEFSKFEKGEMPTNAIELDKILLKPKKEITKLK